MFLFKMGQSVYIVGTKTGVAWENTKHTRKQAELELSHMCTCISCGDRTLTGPSGVMSQFKNLFMRKHGVWSHTVSIQFKLYLQTILGMVNSDLH